MVRLKYMKMMISKYIANTLQSIIIGILIFSFFSPHISLAQSKERTRLRSYFYIKSNGDRQISFLLTAGRGRNMKNVSNASISLEVELGDSTLFLTELVTNQEGNADLLVESGYTFPADEEGITTLLATFAGNDTLRSADTDLEIKDVYLDMSFDVEDSVKILTVEAKELNGDGEFIPVEELDIQIGVRRLYSVLPIDDIETDENGVGILEFPNDIPGDSIGMLTVVARIDEHDYFGTVTKSESIDWGIPVSYELKRMYRQLFTDEAPLWMIIGVFIALVGAWYHFFLSVFKLYKLKKAADNSE
jgi:hypothetical protein